MKAGRNDPCPCGSGRKYKKCCLRHEEEQRLEVRAKRDAGVAAASPPVTREVDEPLSEREQSLNRVWGRIGGNEKLTTAEMDELLDELLALEETEEWCEVMNNFARRGHEDLPGVFRRIAGAVPHTKETALGFFYWAAAEKLLTRGYVDVLPEVGAGVRRLDAESYAYDAVLNVAEIFLAADMEGEALKTVEHFFSIARDDRDLLGGAANEMAEWVFLLRIGRAIRQPDTPSREPVDIAHDLTIGIEEETSEDYARRAAEIATGHLPTSEWTRSQFDLLPDGIPEDAAHLETFSSTVRLAHELWIEADCSPGRSLRGLIYLVDALEAEYESSREKHPKFTNLLDCLRPKGITRRINAFCGEVFGVNPPRALLLLEAHDSLRRFAATRGLISETEENSVKPILARLIESLRSKYFPPARPAT